MVDNLGVGPAIAASCRIFPNSIRDAGKVSRTYLSRCLLKTSEYFVRVEANDDLTTMSVPLVFRFLRAHFDLRARRSDTLPMVASSHNTV